LKPMIFVCLSVLKAYTPTFWSTSKSYPPHFLVQLKPHPPPPPKKIKESAPLPLSGSLLRLCCSRNKATRIRLHIDGCCKNQFYKYDVSKDSTYTRHSIINCVFNLWITTSGPFRNVEPLIIVKTLLKKVKIYSHCT